MDDEPVLGVIQKRSRLAWPPYKTEIMAFIARLAPLSLFTGVIPTHKWQRGFHRRHPEICQRTPSMANIQRGMSTLTKDQWE